jgi:subtilisin family serine protease
MPDVVSDQGIPQINVPDLKKVSKSLKDLILNRYSFTDSTSLDFFLVFESRESVRSFLSNRSSNVTILYEFTIVPALLVKCNINILSQLAEDNRIISIEGNYRGYLCVNDIQVKMEIPRIQTSFFKPLGKSVRIAVLDSGISSNHPDLKDRVIGRYNITSEEEDDICGHGTMLAGIICVRNAMDNNSLKGIAPESKLIDVKITDKTGILFSSDILLGLESIKDEAVNIILFGMTTPFETEGNDVLSKACKIFSERGVILIAPSGNLGPDSGFCGTPASSPNVISVGSIDFEEKISFFSSRGNQSGYLKPDIVVPSVQITTTRSENSILGIPEKSSELYSKVSGTSIAAAIVAGIIALILESNSKLTRAEIIEAVNATSTDLFVDKQSQGLGMPNLIRLFKFLNIYLDNPLPYRELVKKSVIITCVLSSLVIVLFVVSYLVFNWFF